MFSYSNAGLPEPKFRVGDIVCVHGGSEKVNFLIVYMYYSTEYQCWKYCATSGNSYKEPDLTYISTLLTYKLPEVIEDTQTNTQQQ